MGMDYIPNIGVCQVQTLYISNIKMFENDRKCPNLWEKNIKRFGNVLKKPEKNCFIYRGFI